MIILSYNLRGLGNRAKQRSIRALIQREKIDLVCFQETKVAIVDTSICTELWGNEDVSWVFSPAINRGGGLLCIWRNSALTVVNFKCNARWISLQGKWEGQNEECMIVNVYASCSLEEKRQLWAELEDWRSRSSIKCWCILGDFNAVRESNERRGTMTFSSQLRRDSELFNDFIHSMELVDVSLVGKRFTWFRPNGTSMSRLDRFLVSLEWLEQWPHSVQQVMDRDFSDHCPVILKHMNQDWGPKPFRVLNCWHKDPRFRKFIAESWGGLVAHGPGVVVLKEKLKKLKVLMKNWNLETFGDLNAKKKVVISRMNQLDQMAENQHLSDEELRERRDLMAELWRVGNLHESLLCQKSRVKWLQEGDANTSFFHGVINWKRRSNSLKGLSLNGQWVEDPYVVKKEVKKFFESKFSESSDVCPNLDGVPFSRITERDNVCLTAKFEIEEIKEAVWDCDGSKSPGPDGYNFRFIKEYWHLLKDDMKQTMDEFHDTGKWPRGTNSSFLALIPKIDSPQSLNDFRPISLVGCLYKVVTKILAARIKKVLPQVITDTQFAFLGGRGMLDSVLIANEAVHDAKMRKSPSLIFKVDFEKAYDSIRWRFLVYMMRRLNFCEKWVMWVVGCLESSFVSVLVNGSPTDEFKMEKGVRQGDPLAPFLFLIVAEGLNGILKQAVETNNFIPLKVGKDEPVELSILQFADDALFIGKACIQNVIVLKCVLRCFELASGMKVNFHKSKLAGISVREDVKVRFAALLHCRVMAIPFVYLGLPIGGSPRRLSTWEPVLAKMRKRLSTWKGKHLSFGGRICLIRSVLTALPLYFISFFRLPKGVLKSCNQIMMRFLWGGSDEVKKIPWVSWANVCRPKSEGGLGVRDLDQFNVALLGKWRWRMLHEQEQLWCRVLISKYGKGHNSRASAWWKDLLTSCVGEPAGLWFENGLCWRLGEGNYTHFWEENWHGQGIFQERFADLFRLSEQKGMTLMEVGKWVDGKWIWDFKWSENVTGEKASQLATMVGIASSTTPIRGRSDAWCWVRERDGIYSVKSAYDSLCYPDVEREEACFKLLWKIGATSNALSVGWKVLLNRIQTRDNLMRRQIPITDPLCPLCGVVHESVSHLFLLCPHVLQVWSLVLDWLGFCFVAPASVKDHFLQFHGLWSSSPKAGLFTVWLAVIWHVWMGRNGKIFKDANFDPQSVFELARVKAWEWLRYKTKSFLHGTYEWINEPLSCLDDSQ